MLPMCAEMGVGCIPYSQARAASRGAGEQTQRSAKGCGCEDIRLDVTLTGAEIRMLEEPFTQQTPYWL
jgi:hypothetical protein